MIRPNGILATCSTSLNHTVSQYIEKLLPQCPLSHTLNDLKVYYLQRIQNWGYKVRWVSEAAQSWISNLIPNLHEQPDMKSFYWCIAICPQCALSAANFASSQLSASEVCSICFESSMRLWPPFDVIYEPSEGERIDRSTARISSWTCDESSFWLVSVTVFLILSTESITSLGACTL